MISKKLQRQIKSAFQLSNVEEVFPAQLQELKAKAELSAAEQLLVQLLEGFPAFIDSIQNNYEQAEKMLAIVNRSLVVSSEELTSSNAKLSEMNKTIETMLANLSQDLVAAREVQRSLLPPQHQDFPTAKVDVIYQPAEQLSGDFFDVNVKGPWLYFYIADVTSHGTASAQVTYIVKGIFQELVASSAEAMELPSIMHEFGMRYLTYKLPYAVGLQLYRFHTETKILQILLSNTPPPIRVRESAGETIFVQSQPMILSGAHETGTAENIQQAHEIQMQPGDKFFCYTDGILEYNKKTISEKALAKIMAGTPEDGWDTHLIDTIKQRQQTDKFDDDTTVLRLLVK